MCVVVGGGGVEGFLRRGSKLKLGVSLVADFTCTRDAHVFEQK